MKTTFISRDLPLKASICFLMLLLSWGSPALATDNYAYQRGEYATISGGKSPDGHWSIAAHGDGEYGYDGFQLYLMREPTREKLASLPVGGLDTAPLSLVALWAPDSRHVAILYRSDRRVLDLRLFSVADGKAQSIAVPLLVNVVGQKYLKTDVPSELRSRLYRITWQKPNRLALEEHDAFDAHQPIFRAGLEPYLQVDMEGPERAFTDFSASATCEITKDGQIRLSDLKPLSHWPTTTIVYSPHLLFDPQRGLYDTETTLSSIEEQKSHKRNPTP